jgi:hypothetical protein
MCKCRAVLGIAMAWVLCLESLGSFGCTCRRAGRGNKPVPSSQRADRGDATTGASGEQLNHGQAAGLSRDLPRRCGGIPNVISERELIDAVADACFPGSVRQGPILALATSRKSPTILELPQSVAVSCWSAVVLKGSTRASINFELLDMADGRHHFAITAGERTVMPEDGPFCSISGRFRGLRASTTSDVSVPFQFAWYTAASGTEFAQ